MTPKAFARSTASLGFVHNKLDRQANRRDDEAYLATLAALPSARTLGVIGDAVVLKRTAGAGLGDGRDPWFGLEEAGQLGRSGERAFLGEDTRGPVFATLIEREAEALLADHAELALSNLRQVAVDGSVSSDDLGSLAEGKALLFWHAKHRFCANCSKPTLASAGGWRRECSACGTHHFPRTDPVVIMLAIDGDRCLLGRQPRFPVGMYSCLAGFLEPGETIEDAVRREIAEEAGIATGIVTYLGSQTLALSGLVDDRLRGRGGFDRDHGRPPGARRRAVVHPGRGQGHAGGPPPRGDYLSGPDGDRPSYRSGLGERLTRRRWRPRRFIGSICPNCSPSTVMYDAELEAER